MKNKEKIVLGTLEFIPSVSSHTFTCKEDSKYTLYHDFFDEDPWEEWYFYYRTTWDHRIVGEGATPEEAYQDYLQELEEYKKETSDYLESLPNK